MKYLITKTERILVSELSKLILLPSRTAVLLPNGLTWQVINIIGLASANVADETETKEKIYTTTLTVKTEDDLAHDGKAYCYRITLCSGEQFLIGTNERPYVVSYEDTTMPSSAPENQGKTYKLTYKNTFNLLRILN